MRTTVGIRPFSILEVDDVPVSIGFDGATVQEHLLQFLASPLNPGLCTGDGQAQSLAYFALGEPL